VGYRYGEIGKGGEIIDFERDAENGAAGLEPGDPGRHDAYSNAEV
jgi:hypothetical protein